MMTPPDDSFIRFESVRKSFGGREVLRGVTQEVRRGETLVILGGSGQGKSVLLRHVIGLLKPDSGEVWVDGEEVSSYDETRLMPVRRQVGMLFQGGALFDSMNVFDNVAFGLRENTRLTPQEIAERVRDKLGVVGLREAEQVMPASLSGGMKKRVALARAIAMEPRGLLYDEPTTGLDPITANTINDLIRSLQERLDVTSIVVTHDIASAYRVADRIALLSEGRIHFVGTVDEARSSDEPVLRRFLSGGRPTGETPWQAS